MDGNLYLRSMLLFVLHRNLFLYFNVLEKTYFAVTLIRLLTCNYVTLLFNH